MTFSKFAAAGAMALLVVAAQAKPTEPEDLRTSSAGRGAAASVLAAKPLVSDGRRWRISNPHASHRALTFAEGASSQGDPGRARDRSVEIPGAFMGGEMTFAGRGLEGDHKADVDPASKAMSDGAITDLTFRAAYETDDFRVTSVPEPETYALMLTGLCALVVVVRRRRGH